jgi:diguanylate cyclase (GGDEF)-like protein
MNWNVLPDIAVFILICIAFASVLRGHDEARPVRWLLGWLLILVHCIFQLFINLPGSTGTVTNGLATLSLVWAGIFFIWQMVPYKRTISSVLLTSTILTTYAIFIAVSSIDKKPSWSYDLAASTIAIGPLLVMIFSLKQIHSVMRLVLIGNSTVLATVLIYYNHHPESSSLFKFYPLELFTYLACAILFTITNKKVSIGALLSVIGMYLWASVFLVGPYFDLYHPNVHIESEVWNLPKFVVAVGMLLTLLEEQVSFSRRLAMNDALTGLPNRRLFEDRLARSIERARRSKTKTALLMIDMNHFKEVNDTFGHVIGDEVLKYVSMYFEKNVRRIDTVARTGGDEFAIVLECPITKVDAEKIGRKLMKEVHSPLQLGDKAVPVKFSIGVAMYPDDATDSTELYMVADHRMYSDKKRHNGGPAAH